MSTKGPGPLFIGTKPRESPQTTRNLIAPSSETTHHLVEFSKSARLTSFHNEKTPRAIGFHMKKKFYKDIIFIPPFMTGPDMRYKRGHSGILPKKCHVAPSPLATQMAPLATRGIAHSTRGEFYTADVPPSPDISQPTPATGLKRSAIRLPRSDMSRSSSDAYPKYIRGLRFRFPGQLDSSDTREFAGSISAHNQEANSDNAVD